MQVLKNFPSISFTTCKVIAAVFVVLLTTVIMVVIISLSKFLDVHPWPVFIKLDGNLMCTGSLIHKKYVLTSASCVELIDDTSRSKLKVIVGLDYATCDVERIYSHPAYRSSTFKNNIALIRLQQEVALFKYIRSLLPGPELELLEGEDVVVVETQFTMMTSYIANEKTCQKKFADAHPSKTFCAFLPSQYSNCLINMKGAPVTVNRKYGIGIFSLTSNKNYVVGIYSKQSPCGNGTDHLNLYTNVLGYVDFIENHIAAIY